MSYAHVTPRDLLAMNANPARIKIREIVARFGIGPQQASELRALACRSPQVLAQHHPIAPKGRSG
jgi:hypothetical protein